MTDRIFPDVTLTPINQNMYLLNITMEGQPSTELIIDRRFGVCLAQLLSSEFLQRKPESFVLLQALV